MGVCSQPGTALLYGCGIVAEGVASAEDEVGDEGTFVGTRHEALATAMTQLHHREISPGWC
jgi:hypothetical protein